MHKVLKVLLLLLYILSDSLVAANTFLPIFEHYLSVLEINPAEIIAIHDSFSEKLERKKIKSALSKVYTLLYDKAEEEQFSKEKTPLRIPCVQWGQPRTLAIPCLESTPWVVLAELIKSIHSSIEGTSYTMCTLFKSSTNKIFLQPESCTEVVFEPHMPVGFHAEDYDDVPVYYYTLTQISKRILPPEEIDFLYDTAHHFFCALSPENNEFWQSTIKDIFNTLQADTIPHLLRLLFWYLSQQPETKTIPFYSEYDCFLIPVREDTSVSEIAVLLNTYYATALAGRPKITAMTRERILVERLYRPYHGREPLYIMLESEKAV